MSPPVMLRRWQPGDQAALARICLRTGAAGGDATARYRDPDLLALFYALPYPLFDAELCWVIDTDAGPAGYILGTGDSSAFRDWTEAHWFPPLRKKYPLENYTDDSADASIVRLVHEGYRQHPDTLDFPAHLHIDLLPQVQRRGLGTRLMEPFLAELRRRGCPGVHLGVAEENQTAMAFYERIGFSCLGRYPGWRAYGLRLDGERRR